MKMPWIVRVAFLMTLVCMPHLAAAQNLVIQARELRPVASPTLKDAIVVVRDGKIAAVGKAGEVAIPAGFEILKAAVVTPGFIDVRGCAGLSGRLNQPHDQDHQEKGDAIQPELRALDAFDVREPLVAWIREHGVTTLHATHGPGALVAGTSVILKTREAPLEETVIVREAMIVASLADEARNHDEKGSPGTKAKMVSLLRSRLIAAGEYLRKRETAPEVEKPPRDLGLEALATTLGKKRPMLLTVKKERDIHAALRLAKEFDLDLVLDGVEDAHLMLDALAAAGVRIAVHPTMRRSEEESEHLAMDTAAKLSQREIPFAFMSGYESYVPKTRVVLLEAQAAVAHGLDDAAALRALTLDAAELLGIAGRTGSIEVGKDADLVLFDGDPFEYVTHVTGVVIDGRIASKTVR